MNGMKVNSDEAKRSSSPAESHHQTLREPDVNLAIHPAPIIQPPL